MLITSEVCLILTYAIFYLYYYKQLHVAINIYSDVHICVLFLLHIQIFRTCLCHVFLDFQKHSTIDIELGNICYTLPCECRMTKIEHTKQQDKDL